VTIDRAGIPFIALAALPAAAAAVAGWSALAAGLAVPAVGLALFFRDPERRPPSGSRLVLAPADGTVLFAGDADPDEAPPGRWKQVSIFLSLFDVHINRTPIAGTVTRVELVPGSFKAAYRPDAHANEHSEIWIDAGGTTVVARQVVGVLARRVVCRVGAGDTLGPGERIGLMKFGSRMDVFVPPDSVLEVSRTDRVRAGETVIARLSTRPPGLA
jgi:phosphatidylserine decarboxylase